MAKKAPAAVDESDPSEEVLRRLRIPFVHKASLTRGAQTQDVFTIDMGLAGVFIEFPEAPAVGEAVAIRFPLPGNEIPISAKCRVAWRHAGGRTLQSKSLPPGVGLQFLELSEMDRTRIREHVLEHFRRHPRVRRFLRHWPESELKGDDPTGQGEDP